MGFSRVFLFSLREFSLELKWNFCVDIQGADWWSEIVVLIFGKIELYTIKYHWFNISQLLLNYLIVQSFYLDQQFHLVLYSNRIDENLKCIQSNQISIDFSSKIHKCLILFHKFILFKWIFTIFLSSFWAPVF